MKIFPHADIQAIENATLRESGESHADFISRSGRRMGYEILGEWREGMKTVVFAGPGLNGAYALAACVELAEQGLDPQIYLFNQGGNTLKPECREAKNRLQCCEADYELEEVTGLNFTMPDLGKNCLVVDGIFGSELTTPLPTGYQQLVRYINESKAKIIALELPSGLPANSTICLISRNVIHADVTVDLGLPRLSFFMPENYDLIGEWRSIGMEFSDLAIRKSESKYYLVERHDIRRLLPPRSASSSKADYGHAMLFAGSRGMAGASLLATLAALRSGCGKVTCHGPESSRVILQTAAPGAMFQADPNPDYISDFSLDHDYDAVGIGPGIGTAEQTVEALGAFLKIASANGRQVVLDADALNCLAIKPALLDYLPTLSVLTPHAGEFDRLFGSHPSSEARLAKAMEMADFYKIIIILKGHHTAVVRPDRRVFFNSTGTSALAKGGTGDVLTGLLTGLMASHVRPEIAAVIGVYIHGLAGEIVERENGMYSLTPEDLVKAIGAAFVEAAASSNR